MPTGPFKFKRWREFPSYRSERSNLSDWAREELAGTTDELAVLQSLWDDPNPEVRAAARGRQENPVEVLAEAPAGCASPIAREKYAHAVLASRKQIILFLEATEELRFTDDAVVVTLGEVAAKITSEQDARS